RRNDRPGGVARTGPAGYTRLRTARADALAGPLEGGLSAADLTAAALSPGLRQVHQPPEAVEHLPLERRKFRGIKVPRLHQGERLAPRLLENLHVANQAGDPQRHLTMLANARNVPGPADLKV